MLRDGVLSVRTTSGRVVLVDRSDARLRELEPPTASWRPTAVVTDGSRVWVADGYGYGENLVHAFDHDGTLLWTTDASASRTTLSPPARWASIPVAPSHGCSSPTAETIASSRSPWEESTSTPSASTFSPPLRSHDCGRNPVGVRTVGAVVGLDRAADVIANVGDASVPADTVWPNTRVGNQITAPDRTLPQLRSPHGIAARATGELLVTEWLIGGRATTLSPIWH